MFRIASPQLHRFSTGSGSWKPSFGSLTFPSWRKCGIGENGKIHCHMISTLCHQNRPISVFHLVKLKKRTAAVIKFNSGIRTYYNSKFIFISTKKVYKDHFQTFSTTTISSSTKAGSMGAKGPGLIVFDLDCTLWPLHVDTTHNPPFEQKDDKIVDQDGRVITYYPEVPQVLEYLKSEGYPIGVASRTTKPPAAEQLLKFFDWNKYVSYKEIYPGSKITHFARFAEQTKLPHAQMLFFDDEQRNIIDMQGQGVKCVFVKNGVDLQLVKDSIEQFKNGSL